MRPSPTQWHLHTKGRTPFLYLGVICKEYLLTRSNLCRRHMEIDVWCPQCVATAETSINILFNCPCVRHASLAAAMSSFTVFFPNFLSWWIAALRQYTLVELSQVCMLLWDLRKRCNEHLWANKWESAIELLASSSLGLKV